MAPSTWLVIALLVTGIVIRLFAWRPYLNRHAQRYHEAPPRGWLWTSVDDPEVERFRRYMVIGSVLAIGGSLALLYLALTGTA